MNEKKCLTLGLPHSFTAVSEEGPLFGSHNPLSDEEGVELPSIEDARNQQSAMLLPDVSHWTLDGLSNEQLRLQATEVVGADLSASSLMQWQTSVMKFSRMVRSALSATRHTFALLGVDTSVMFDAVDFSLSRGELRSRVAVKQQMGQKAGAVLHQILLVERTEEELAELEEEIAHPSTSVLRLGQLRRHRRILDLISNDVVIDLTLREGDEDEARSAIVECQNRLRGFASAAGLNTRGTPKRQLARVQLEKKDVVAGVGDTTKRRKKKGVAVGKESSLNNVEADVEKDIAEEKDDEELNNEEASHQRQQQRGQKKRERHVQETVVINNDANDKDDVEANDEGDERGSKSDEQGDGDEPSEEADWKSQLQVDLGEAECSVVGVLELLATRKDESSVSLEFNPLDPTLDLANAATGETIAQDAEKLQALLQQEPVRSSVEEWGKLLGWWWLVRRSLSFAGLFDHLDSLRKPKKQQKGKGGRPRKQQSLEAMWNDLVKRVRGRLSYKHACQYRDIGNFLKAFPGFIYQTQFITKEQWTRTYKKRDGQRGKPFTVVLKQVMSKKEKSFWSSKERLGEYYASMRPTGEMPDGPVVQFRMERVLGDGDCGFTVIGIPREEAADALEKNLDNEDIRKMIGMEIRSMLMDGVDEKLGLPVSVLDDAIRQLLHEHVETQTKIDEDARAGHINKKLEDDLAALEKEIASWCEDKETCERFISTYIRNAENDGYLQTAVREIGTAYTTLDALARIYDFRAAIWQRDKEDVSQVRFIGWINKESVGKTVHMLHDGRVHLDLLVLG